MTAAVPAVRLGAVRLGAVRLGAVRLGAVRLGAALLLGAAVLVGPAVPPAAAHQPVFVRPGIAPLLVDGTVSFAVYGTLAGQDAREVRIGYREGDAVLVELLIPDADPERGLPDADLPTATLTGPAGVVARLRPRFRRRFDEPFSRTSYLRLDRYSGTAQAGRWRLTVTGRAAARFVVAIGGRETGGQVEDYLPGPEADVGAWFRRPPARSGGSTAVSPGAGGEASGSTTTPTAPATPTAASTASATAAAAAPVPAGTGPSRTGRPVPLAVLVAVLLALAGGTAAYRRATSRRRAG